jgi:hypothetical protein
MGTPQLSVLVFAETGRHWTARALEHDIAVQGPSAEGAVDALVKIVRAHVAFDVRHNRHPLSGFPPAPRLYWNAFRAATRQSPGRELDCGEVEGSPRIVMATADRNPAAYRNISLSLSA